MSVAGANRDWVVHVDNFVDPDESESSQAASYKALSELLRGKKVAIKDIVSAMGEYLTSTDNSMRGRGIILLGDLIGELALMPLEDTTVHSLAAFLTVKLEDWHSLRGTLVGALALLRRSAQVGAVQGDDVKNMAKSASQSLNVQNLGLTDRLLSLELYECLLTQHGASVSSLGSDLVDAVCAAIEKEKDPRCLLVAFSLVEHLVELFHTLDGPLAEWAEDLFDIVGQYFPVTFNPLPNDTRGISRDDLADALLNVFKSTPLFAGSCIPLLLEKLSSSLKSAKLDSLRYLGICALSFGPQVMFEHVGAIWPALKAELIPATVPAFVSLDDNQKDTRVREEALICLTRCVKAFQKGIEGRDSQIEGGLLKLVCEDECIEDLFKCVEGDRIRESQLGSCEGSYDKETSGPASNISSARANERTMATGLILAAAMRASPSSCHFVTERILSRLISSAGIHPRGLLEAGSSDITIPKSSEEGGDKHPLSIPAIKVIIKILEAAGLVAKEITVSTTVDTTVSMEPISKKWLEPVSSEAVSLLMTFIQVTAGQVQNADPSQIGVAGLQTLALFPAAFSPLNERQHRTVLLRLLENILDQTSASNLRENSVKAILAISNLEEHFGSLSDDRKSTVLNVATPKLLEACGKAQAIADLEAPLQALAALAGLRQVVRLAVVDGMRQLIGTEFREALIRETATDTSRKVAAILDCLSRDIIPLCERGSTDQVAACNIITDMWSTIQGAPDRSHLEVLSSSVMAINRVVVRGCTEAAQEKILSTASIVLLYQNQKSRNADSTEAVEGVVEDWASCFATEEFTREKRWLVALVASIVIGLRPAVLVPRNDLLIMLFLRASLSGPGAASIKGDLTAQATAQATASIINKWTDGFIAIGGNINTLSDAIEEVVDRTLLPVLSHYLEAGSHTGETAYRAIDTEKVVRAIYALAWVGQGLAMRGHSRVADVAAVLLSVIQLEGNKYATTEQLQSRGRQVEYPNRESVVAHAATESIGIIVKDDATCLDRVHNACVKPLFKQRFFNSMLPPLQAAVRAAGNHPYRIWFFRAFGLLLASTPHAAILTEGQKVFPLVLEGLSTLCYLPEDSDILLSTALILSLFLTDESSGRKIAAEHVTSMVNRLENLLRYRFSSTVRITALQSLAAIVGFPFTLVFPHKHQVVKAVTAALDDYKRSVRTEAGRCLRLWAVV